MPTRRYTNGYRTYDSFGNLVTATDSTGTTTLSYDSANRLTEILYPDGLFLKYTYDSAGRRMQMVDQTGYTVGYVYNPLGQLAGLTDGSGTSIIASAYDAAGRLLESVKGNAALLKYTYDAAGNMLSVINHAPDGSINSSFVYTYNDLGPHDHRNNAAKALGSIPTTRQASSPKPSSRPTIRRSCQIRANNTSTTPPATEPRQSSTASPRRTRHQQTERIHRRRQRLPI